MCSRPKVRQLGTLVAELEDNPAERGNTAARELVKLLMEVHGTALERMMEFVFESGAAGREIIAKAGEERNGAAAPCCCTRCIRTIWNLAC